MCSDLLEGGITPSSGLIAAVRARVNLGVYVMIRPRGGDFVYSPIELEIMATDIEQAKKLGANGVVLGVLTPDGDVDVPHTRALVERAAPLDVTFHRAIDVTRDMRRAFIAVAETGARRILTSGGKATALRGAEQIAAMVRLADARMSVMAGSGVRASNAAELAQLTGVSEFHAALRTKANGPMVFRTSEVRMGTDAESDFVRYEVLERDVRALRKALDCGSAPA